MFKLWDYDIKVTLCCNIGFYALHRVIAWFYFDEDYNESQRCIQSASLPPGTHSFFFRTQRILNEGSNWTQKKIRMIMQITNSRKKTASYDMQIFISWKQFLSADWLLTFYFAVNFQTKAEKLLCFLVTFLSR